MAILNVMYRLPRSTAGGRHWRLRSLRSLLPAVLLLPCWTACRSDGLNPPPLVDQRELYWALELNEHAVTLALTPPYDTLTLSVTARNAVGEPLAGVPSPQYVSTNRDVVDVTPDGVLHAVSETSSQLGNRKFLIPVIATLTMGNLKHADTVLVKVVNTTPLPVLGTLSIHPTPPDSAKSSAWGPSSNVVSCFGVPAVGSLAGNYCDVVHSAQVLDAAGVPIPGIPVAFSSSDPTVARVSNGADGDLPGFIRPGRTGLVTLYAKTTVLGVTKADTLPFRIGLPVYRLMELHGPALEPETKVGIGAVIIWVARDVDTSAIDVTFAEPAAAGAFGPAPNFIRPFLTSMWCSATSPWFDCNASGNVLLSGAANPDWGSVAASRRFLVPGTYEYHSTALGTSGRIVVVDER